MSIRYANPDHSAILHPNYGYVPGHNHIYSTKIAPLVDSGEITIEAYMDPLEDSIIMSRRVRERRDQLLSKSDGKSMPFLEAGLPIPSELLDYKVALRDIPQQPGFPLEVIWPEYQEGG